MKEASPHKENTKGVSSDGSGEESGKRGIEFGVRWATEDSVGLMAGGCGGRHAGRKPDKEGLGVGPSGACQRFWE